MNKNKAQAIVLILLAGFFFSLMTFFVRLSGDLPTMQKVFFRNLVAVLVATVILFRSPEGFRIKKNKHSRYHHAMPCGNCGRNL